MTDLSQLFLTHKPTPSPEFLAKAFASQQQPPVKNLFGTRLFPNVQPQPKSTLQTNSLLITPLRKTQKQLSKMTIASQGMSQEIQYFKTYYFKQFAKKAIYILVPIFALQIFGLLNGKVSFESMLFGLSLLALETQIIENKSLKIFINTLPILTYLALFYDILSLSNFAANYHVTLANVPALLVSLVASVNFVLFRKVAFLPNQQTKTISTGAKWNEIINNFIQNYVNRIKNTLKMVKYSITFNVILMLVFIVYCIINLNTNLFSSTLNTIPYGFVVYFMVDFFVFSVEFVSREIQLFDLRQKFYQIDVCVGLLRIKNTSKTDEYEKIHERCLLELTRQLKKNIDYLETPVKVNYAINSYRDIFQIYAIEDLNNLLSSLTEITVKISNNNKIIESTKTFKQDMFILIKKYLASANNNYQTYRFLAELQKRQLVFLILTRLASEEPLKNKVMDQVEQIISNVNKLSSGKSLLEVGQIKLQNWKEKLENLRKGLKEGSSKSTSYVSERDENGWCHYRRGNPNDILEN